MKTNPGSFKALVDEVLEGRNQNYQDSMKPLLIVAHEQEVEEAYDKVTRFEVIDWRQEGEGRILVKYGVRVKLELQDDSRTLKVFLTESSDEH